MHRAFVHLASVRIFDGGAQHDRSYGRKRERNDDEQRQHIPQPWKSFMWLAIHSSDFDLVYWLDHPAFLGPIPKRREFWGRRLECFLEMRLVSHQHISECHSVGPGAIRVGAALEQEQRVCIGERMVEA